MHRVAIPVFFFAALVLPGAEPPPTAQPSGTKDGPASTSDTSVVVDFVPKVGLESVRELSIPAKAKDKYADGERRLKRDDVEGARHRFEEAVELAPDYAAAWNALGVLASDDQVAEQHFRRAAAADPDNVDAAMNLGAALLKSGRAEEALGYNHRVALSLPSDAAAQAQYGMNLYQLGKLAGAEDAFLRAKKLNAALASMPQLFLAEIYARRGEKARAIAELDELLARDLSAELESSLRGALARLQ